MHPDVPQTTAKDVFVQYAISLQQNNGLILYFFEKMVLIDMQKITKYRELQVLH